MSKVYKLGQAIFGLVVARHAALPTSDCEGVFYIGLGDQFDDDRRLVREAVTRSSATMRRSWLGPFRPVMSADRLSRN